MLENDLQPEVTAEHKGSASAALVPPGTPFEGPRPKYRLRRFALLLRRNPRLLIGGLIILIMVTAAVLAPVLPLPDPETGEASKAYQPPSFQYLMGTDNVGRDVLSRVIWGARISLSVGFIAVTIGIIVGGCLGLLAGYFGSWLDAILSRLVDAMLAFPAILLAIAITAALGPQLQNSMLAIGIVNIPVFARLARGQAMQVKVRDYIEASRALGLKNSRILRRHVLPNILNPLIVQASLSIAFAILAEATLSFLGLGAQPPTPTWGFDINQARGYLANNYWWMALGPGSAIMITIFGFNLLGDSIRDILDPRLRKL
ncbi:MAG TPA: ABC transporter permease [Chloroflexia bacterium]|nr:ABC transporter permease [Chloroflexia bacterium]